MILLLKDIQISNDRNSMRTCLLLKLNISGHIAIMQEFFILIISREILTER